MNILYELYPKVFRLNAAVSETEINCVFNQTVINQTVNQNQTL